MKTSQKIKIWAHIGAIACWVLYMVFDIMNFETQSTINPICEIIAFLLIVLFSEAIVHVIGYFAELLDK